MPSSATRVTSSIARVKRIAPAPATSPIAIPMGSQRAIRRELSVPTARDPTGPSSPLTFRNTFRSTSRIVLPAPARFARAGRRPSGRHARAADDRAASSSR